MSEQPVAISRYRQFRLTATQERSGILAYSIYAKGLNQRWDEHQLLVRDRCDLGYVALLSTEDVVHALITILREQLLPGSID